MVSNTNAISSSVNRRLEITRRLGSGQLFSNQSKYVAFAIAKFRSMPCKTCKEWRKEKKGMNLIAVNTNGHDKIGISRVAVKFFSYWMSGRKKSRTIISK